VTFLGVGMEGFRVLREMGHTGAEFLRFSGVLGQRGAQAPGFLAGTEFVVE